MLKNKIKFARNLRKQMSDAEIKLWQRLRDRQIDDLHFRKQAPMGKYIVDFVCHKIRVIIEVDGGQHNEQIEYDSERTRWLETQGYKVQRFWNNEVLQQIDNVMEVIWDLCASRRNL
ncbi:MAG TPA: endonuclease domain-containing protein [Gammaproteobacteria bacterium]|nr:endonuclease domain-containing protein [Gammaproteobacteria bacterium]